jgi:hypothetical protein
MEVRCHVVYLCAGSLSMDHLRGRSYRAVRVCSEMCIVFSVADDVVVSGLEEDVHGPVGDLSTRLVVDEPPSRTAERLHMVSRLFEGLIAVHILFGCTTTGVYNHEDPYSKHRRKKALSLGWGHHSPSERESIPTTRHDISFRPLESVGPDLTRGSLNNHPPPPTTTSHIPPWPAPATP